MVFVRNLARISFLITQKREKSTHTHTNRETFGMVSLPASRADLLSWLNEVTQLGITKIEQCGTGAALCQVMDSLYGTYIIHEHHPSNVGDVSLQKVKFASNLEWEYVHNFKVLQETFTKHSIDKAIPVQRLIKLKFQDNLEFLQWTRKFWEGKGGSLPGYNSVERRGGSSVVSSNKAEGIIHYLMMCSEEAWITATSLCTIYPTCITGRNQKGD
jgi:hypothetical protein